MKQKFVAVECRNISSPNDKDDEKSKNEPIYKNLHAVVLEKPKLKNANLSQPMSVMIIGVDSVSRLNMIRTMPKTRSVLSQKYRAVEMKGYHKVGDNSHPNIMPVLTGKSADELVLSCWKMNTKADDCHWIWKNYSSRGYKTIFMSDMEWV